MPGLRMCGRRWTIGGDNFVFSSIRHFVLHVAVVVMITLVLWDDKDCGESIREYLMTSFGVHSVAGITSLTLAVLSGRGTILEPDSKRKYVPHFVIISIVLAQMLLGIAIWGTIAIVGNEQCSGRKKKWILAMIILQWVVACVSLMGYIWNLDCAVESDDPYDDSHKEVWRRRCKLAFCCLHTTKTSDAFEDISHVMAGIFSNIDLVLSDISAGLLLVRAKQLNIKRCKQIALKLVNPKTGLATVPPHTSLRLAHEVTSPLPVLSDTAEMDLTTAHSYSKFAMGAYGWPLFVFAHPLTCCTSLCGAWCSGKTPKVRTDNCCNCNSAAWTAETGLGSKELIEASWESELQCPAHYICVDESKRSIIIGVRGTMAASDALTDARADAIPFNDEHIPGATAHAGIGNSAKSIKKFLMKSRHIDKVLEKHPDYRIVVLGHSLGAGTAALLAVLLRNDYGEKVLGLSYSPPGGLMNKILSDHSKKYIIAVGLGQDLVPRSSIATIRNLRSDIIESIGETKQPKCCITGCFCCLSNKSQANSWLNLKETAPTDDCSNESKNECSKLDPALNESSSLVSLYLQGLSRAATTEPLYPPGNYIHIMRVGNNPKEVFYPVEKDVEKLMEEGIQVGVAMVVDHIPDRTFDAIKYCMDLKARQKYAGWGKTKSMYTPPPPTIQSPVSPVYLSNDTNEADANDVLVQVQGELDENEPKCVAECSTDGKTTPLSDHHPDRTGEDRSEEDAVLQ